MAPPPASGAPSEGSVRDRIVTLLREHPDGLTTSDIAQHLGVHPNTARFHLARLGDAGHVEWRDVRGTGRGRPFRVFSVRPNMQRTIGRDYVTLAKVALDAIAHTPDPHTAAVEAGRRWGDGIATEPQRPDSDASDALMAEMEDLGFAPRPGADPGQIDLHQCPFLEAVETHGELVCATHLGLMQSLSRRLSPGRPDPTLTPFARPGVCVAHVSWADPSHAKERAR